jgi:peroxin-14
MSSIRKDMVDNAVKFLSDVKVQEAPLAKRISFLESKGMTADEIEVALKQSKGESVTNTFAPPLPPKLQTDGMGWKDVAIGLVGVVGAGYGLLYLAKRYLSPFVDFPTAASVEQDTKSIESQLVKSSTVLTQVTAQTNEIINGMDSHAKQVSESLREMNSMLMTLKENDKTRTNQITMITEEVDELKRTFPKLVEKSKENQQQTIQEVQTELKSLKNLLLNRRLPNADGNDSEKQSISITESFKGINVGKPSIPAWQLAAIKKIEPKEELKHEEEDNNDKDQEEEEASDTDTAIHIGKSQDSLI